MIHIPDPPSLDPLPIDDASIVSGNPKSAATVLHSTTDGTTRFGLYSCTPGSFRHVFETEEFMYVLRGRVIIQPDGGEAVELTPGDALVLATGTRVLIDVREELLDLYASWSGP